METISYFLNALLSSSLIVTFVTLKSTKSKARHEAKSVEIDNAQKLLDNFDTFIVKPLKTEVNELRKSVYRLQTAIREIPSCSHADDCPVTSRLAQLDQLQHAETHNPVEKPLPSPADPRPL